jgi:hypothetical protein
MIQTSSRLIIPLHGEWGLLGEAWWGKGATTVEQVVQHAENQKRNL